ncbi:hypothetical protein EUX98_g5311 [Antrodiella citrinella]|uniref:Uncharacterized protein n=1 Tax=Antrodiella citrinella TaxID=2447956 RepID=A0A4S4MZN8_9APHY|nr:hypothetical protein EUX98_g5311 [Antrodiella citrinella]
MVFTVVELIAFSTIFLLAGAAVISRVRISQPPELPGPKRLPLVGNVFTGVPHEEMAAFAKEFGSIFSLNLFGTKAIVVTSVATARELFVKRFGTYSNRLPLKTIEL